MSIVQADPAVQDVVGFTGGGGGGGGGATNTANIFVGLKPLAQRKLSTDQIIARLRPKLASITGARLFLQADTGHPRRRPPEQFAVPVHHPERRPRPSCSCGRRRSPRR